MRYKIRYDTHSITQVSSASLWRETKGQQRFYTIKLSNPVTLGGAYDAGRASPVGLHVRFGQAIVTLGHDTGDPPPSSTNTSPFEKMKIKKFPKLLNYPKRICNTQNPAVL